MIEQKCTFNELIKELNKISGQKGYGTIAKIVLFTPDSKTISYTFDFNTQRL